MEPTKPGAVSTAQFGVGSVLSRTLSTLTQKPIIFFGLALLAVLPAAIIEMLAPPPITTMDPIILIRGVLNMVLTLLVQGATAYAAYQTLKGDPVSFGNAVSRGLARVGVVFVAALLMGVGIFLGTLLLIIPGVILHCLWVVTIPVCMVEKLGPLQSMQRSQVLTKGYRLPIFGMLLLTFIATFLLTAVISLTIGVTAAFSAVTALILAFVLVIPQAFCNVMVSIIYYDLRAVKEGVTLDSLTKVFD